MASPLRILSAFVLLAALLVSSTLHAEDWPGTGRGPTGHGPFDLHAACRPSGAARTRRTSSGRCLSTRTTRSRRTRTSRARSSSATASSSRSRSGPSAPARRSFPNITSCASRRPTASSSGTRRSSRARGLLAGPPAAATAVPAPGRRRPRALVVVFGSSVVAALDVDGKLRWRKEIKPFNFDVAIGNSPVLYKGAAILILDQTKGTKASHLAAYDLGTGEVRYKADRPDADWTHSTPALVTIGGKPQLLVAASSGPQGLDPDTGAKVWWLKSKVKGDTVSPIYADGIVYLDSGRGGPGVAVDPSATGEIDDAKAKWKVANVPEPFSSPVAVGKLMFRSVNPGLITVRDLEDGKELFKERMEGLDSAISPIATADGLVYFAGGGKSYVLKADKTPTVVSMNDLGDPSRASAAIAGNRLYLKGSRLPLWCIGAKQ